MQIIQLLSAILALAYTTSVVAKPVQVVASKKIRGVNYASHVTFANNNPHGKRHPAPPPPPPPPPTTTTTSKSSTTSKTSTTSSPTPTPNNKLVYYGGPIIPNVNVIPVSNLLWGSNVAYSTKLTAFYGNVTASTYYDMLAQYSTPTQKLGRGTAVAPVTLSGYPTKTSLDNDNDIVPYLRNYPIHFAPGISISLQGQGSCVYFCAYHYTITITDIASAGTKYFYYGVIPDQGGSCAGGCGSNSVAFNNFCSVASHELVEATTDPAIGVVTGSSVSAPAAWYDEKDGAAGGEIGDICNAQQGTVNGYTVQKEWSNRVGACVVA
ncbi:hypothetical protein HDU76_004748 [Blyttiomyces sp. JEL0837]|nr:hypothetical protein HDU76_004748 [Blyttiomyces sp. JEL0837]